MADETPRRPSEADYRASGSGAPPTGSRVKLPRLSETSRQSLGAAADKVSASYGPHEAPTDIDSRLMAKSHSEEGMQFGIYPGDAVRYSHIVLEKDNKCGLEVLSAMEDYLFETRKEIMKRTTSLLETKVKLIKWSRLWEEGRIPMHLLNKTKGKKNPSTQDLLDDRNSFQEAYHQKIRKFLEDWEWVEKWDPDLKYVENGNILLSTVLRRMGWLTSESTGEVVMVTDSFNLAISENLQFHRMKLRGLKWSCQRHKQLKEEMAKLDRNERFYNELDGVPFGELSPDMEDSEDDCDMAREVDKGDGAFNKILSQLSERLDALDAKMETINKRSDRRTSSKPQRRNGSSIQRDQPRRNASGSSRHQISPAADNPQQGQRGQRKRRSRPPRAADSSHHVPPNGQSQSNRQRDNNGGRANTFPPPSGPRKSKNSRGGPRSN